LLSIYRFAATKQTERVNEQAFSKGLDTLMPTARIPQLRTPNVGSLPPLNDDVVEISLILPGWQAARLERAAFTQGLTTAQMMRRLLGDFLSDD
jgi:hypothetical protein